MKCRFKKYTLHFIKPGGTSRGVLKTKDTYFLILEDGGRTAIGECNRFINLSYDDRPGYEKKLEEICRQLPTRMDAVLDELDEWPSIFFGVEMLLKDWHYGGERILFPDVFTEGEFDIPINGLIWMGEQADMRAQIDQKLTEGWPSIKLKIGALDFDKELALIHYLRSKKGVGELEIRLDANGAYNYSEALEKLKLLEPYDISYIEQPLPKGNWEEMAELIRRSSIKIALDEDLIGVVDAAQRQALIDTIRPDLLILKPALVGGFQGSDDWKKRIEGIGGDWVVTSALESNIGLNAIAQYVAKDQSAYAQGLGTGMLYSNNFPSPYTVERGQIRYNRTQSWDLQRLI